MSGLSLPRAAAAGLVAGVVWGVAARVWMRLVSTSPEFSWGGTLLIIGLAGALGLGVGLSSAARRQSGWRRWLRVAVVPGMVLFAGQGAPLLPAFVLGGLLIRRRHWVFRVLAMVTIVGPAVLQWRSDRLDEVTMLSAPMRVQVSLLVGMPLLAMALALAGHLVWGPAPMLSVAQSESPERARNRRRNDSSLEVPAGPA